MFRHADQIARVLLRIRTEEQRSSGNLRRRRRRKTSHLMEAETLLLICIMIDPQSTHRL